MWLLLLLLILVSAKNHPLLIHGRFWRRWRAHDVVQVFSVLSSTCHDDACNENESGWLGVVVDVGASSAAPPAEEKAPASDFPGARSL